MVFATFVLAVGGTLLGHASLPDAWPSPGGHLLGWGMAVLVAGAAMVTMVTRGRLLAICALGVVGTGIAAIFLIYGGVDVAMSQLLVEALLVIILALLLPLKVFRSPENSKTNQKITIHSATIENRAAKTIYFQPGDKDRLIVWVNKT